MNGNRTQRFAEVCKVAADLWESFTHLHPDKASRFGAFNRMAKIDPVVTAFAQHSVSVVHGNARLEIFYADLARMTAQGETPPVVTTVLVRPEQRFTIVIDPGKIANMVGLRDQGGVITKLILKNTGAIVLHANLLSPPGSDLLAIPSAPSQEEEAWWFAYAVLALAIGQAASEERSNHRPDTAWQYY